MLYQHYGIYLNDNSIIHYSGEGADFGGNISVCYTSLENFLKGTKQYFVCEFPSEAKYLSQLELILGNSSIWELLKLLKQVKYHLYSPEETVERAKSRLGETSYNLAFNNCEHFAVWCKTGISKSHQVDAVLQILSKSILSQK